MHLSYLVASLVAQTVKHLPAMQETRIRSLVWEDPLEKEMATHSSTLAWKIPWTEEPCRLQSMGSQRVRHDWATSLASLSLCHHKTGFCPILTLRACSAGVSSELVSEPHVRNRSSLVFQSIRVKVDVTTKSSRIQLYVWKTFLKTRLVDKLFH